MKQSDFKITSYIRFTNDGEAERVRHLMRRKFIFFWEIIDFEIVPEDIDPEFYRLGLAQWHLSKFSKYGEIDDKGRFISDTTESIAYDYAL